MMEMGVLSPAQERCIKDQLIRHLDPVTIILFGSAASGMMRADSDVDIAFIANRSFSAFQIFKVAQINADKIGREVDLVDFRQASSVMKAQIVGKRKPLLDEDPVMRQFEFMRALKAYAKLNEERLPVLVKYGYQELIG